MTKEFQIMHHRYTPLLCTDISKFIMTVPFEVLLSLCSSSIGASTSLPSNTCTSASLLSKVARLGLASDVPSFVRYLADYLCCMHWHSKSPLKSVFPCPTLRTGTVPESKIWS